MESCCCCFLFHPEKVSLFVQPYPPNQQAFANLLFIREDREDIEIFPKSVHVATKIKINLFCDPPVSHRFFKNNRIHIFLLFCQIIKRKSRNFSRFLYRGEALGTKSGRYISVIAPFNRSKQPDKQCKYKLVIKLSFPQSVSQLHFIS